jgi:hypothetical protein
MVFIGNEWVSPEGDRASPGSPSILSKIMAAAGGEGLQLRPQRGRTPLR